MKRTSLRKYSVLGLVLLAASAVTAAVIPANSKPDSKDVDNGIKTDSTEGAAQTCRPALEDELDEVNCTYTVTSALNGSATTSHGGAGTFTGDTGSATTA